MRTIGKHRGVEYSVPNSDTGIWHYAVHPKRGRQSTLLGSSPNCPPDGYSTQAEAIKACKEAIDSWLDSRPFGKG